MRTTMTIMTLKDTDNLQKKGSSADCEDAFSMLGDHTKIRHKWVVPHCDDDDDDYEDEDDDNDDDDIDYNDDHDDHDDNGDDDHNGQDDSRVRRPSAPLLGSAPASENLETAPERRPSVRPIRFTRPKKSPPPIDRAHKYSLRKNPTPSKKYQ